MYITSLVNKLKAFYQLILGSKAVLTKFKVYLNLPAIHLTLPIDGA